MATISAGLALAMLGLVTFEFYFGRTVITGGCEEADGGASADDRIGLDRGEAKDSHLRG